MSRSGAGHRRSRSTGFWRRIRRALELARGVHWTNELPLDGPCCLQFDELYYVHDVPEARQAIASGKVTSAFDHYRRFGIASGCSPNPLFKESWYLHTNPDVARAVEAGAFECGFHHFVTNGWYAGRRPNDLIVDEAFYRGSHPEVDDAIASGSCRSAYDHYMTVGAALGWDAHPAFSESWYRKQNESAVDAALSQRLFVNGYQHFMERGYREGVRPNRLFSEREYVQLYPEVATDVATGAHASAFHHYVAVGYAEGRRPNSLAVSENWYRDTYPDADRAIENGAFASAYEHYLSMGAADGRDPHPAFSEAWYRQMHAPEVARSLVSGSYLSAYQYYWETGFALGDRPHPIFNEAEYLELYPEVAELVRSGTVASGFHHYLLSGFAEGRRPNKLIVDESWYRTAHPDADRAIRAGVFRDAYEHYVHQGAREGRDPHPAFSESWYRVTYDVELAVAINAGECVCGYQHYLERGFEIGFRPDARFCSDDYLRIYPDVAEAVATGTLKGAFHHYLQVGHAEGRRPNGMIVHEAWYRQVYPDVDRAIRDGAFGDAYEHYLRRGAGEGRDPHRAFSESWYRQTYAAVVTPPFESGYYLSGYQHFLERGMASGCKPHPAYSEEDYRERHPDVDRMVRDGSWRSAYLHLITIGMDEGRSWRSLSPLAELKQAALRRARGAFEQFMASPRTLDFPEHAEPEVSVVTVLYNKAELSLACFQSLLRVANPRFELIVVDNASSDETEELLARVRGARVIRNDDNRGFIEGSNQGAKGARGRAVLFLNNDTELDPESLHAAFHTLCSWPGAGAVGGRIMRVDGLLEEAGGIVWRDGTTKPYGAGHEAQFGAFLFPRPVDYCTGAFLLVDREAFSRLEGFNPAYKPAYFEDVDLCFRLRAELALDTVYEPRALVYHYGSASASDSQNSEDLWRANRVRFYQRHASILDKHAEPDETSVFVSSDRRTFRGRALVIADMQGVEPADRRAAQLVEVIDTLLHEDCFVTVFAAHQGIRLRPGAVGSALQTGVEVISSVGLDGLKEFLSLRRNVYTFVFADDTLDARELREHGIDPAIAAKVVSLSRAAQTIAHL